MDKKVYKLTKYEKFISNYIVCLCGYDCTTKYGLSTLCREYLKKSGLELKSFMEKHCE